MQYFRLATYGQIKTYEVYTVHAWLSPVGGSGQTLGFGPVPIGPGSTSIVWTMGDENFTGLCSSPLLFRELCSTPIYRYWAPLKELLAPSSCFSRLVLSHHRHGNIFKAQGQGQHHNNKVMPCTTELHCTIQSRSHASGSDHSWRVITD